MIEFSENMYRKYKDDLDPYYYFINNDVIFFDFANARNEHRIPSKINNDKSLKPYILFDFQLEEICK